MQGHCLSGSIFIDVLVIKGSMKMCPKLEYFTILPYKIEKMAKTEVC